MLKKISLVAVMAVSAFAMHSAEININNKDLEVGAKIDMGQFNNTTEPNTVFLNARYLHGSDSHSDFTSSQMHDYGEVGFLMKREIGDSDLSVGLGVKVNHTKKFTTIPLGLEGTYKLPANLPVTLFLNGEFYYAPEVLSMEDAKDFLAYRISLDVEVIENGFITAGFRKLDTNYDNNSLGNNNYNQSVYAGFKFSF